MVNVEAWKNSVGELINKLNEIRVEYDNVLNNWEGVRDEAGDPGKHDVDDMFKALSDARSKLCALKGGKRKHRRTRKQRR